MSTRFPSSIPLTATDSDETELDQNRRQSGRLQCPYLECYRGRQKLGEVVDLSSSGIRVFRKGWLPFRVDSEFRLRLRWHEDSVEVVGRVVRIKKLGWRKHDIGITFVEPSHEAREAITQLARGARYQLKFITERDVA